MKKRKLLLSLLMMMVMMAMSPQRMWADDYTITPLAGTENIEYPEESYQSLFDGTTGTKWCTKTWFSWDLNYAWVIFKIPTKARLKGYSLFDGNDTYHFYGRHWSYWTVYGANFPSDAYATLGSASWEVIDNRERQHYEKGYDESEGIKRSDYNVTTDREYQYYMVRITYVGETPDATEWGEETEIQQMSEMTCTFSPANVTITSQPMDAAYRKGDTPQPLSVTAESNSDITYQWCKGEFYNNKWNYSTIQGATQSTYAPSTSAEGTTRYYCIVRAGGCAQKTYEATVNVQETTASIPTITTQPEASQTCNLNNNDRISLSIVAEVSDGGTLSYQWQKKLQSEEEFTDIEGATTSSYSAKPSSLEDVLIRCVVTNTCNGATSWINSLVSSIHVTGTPAAIPTITTQPEATLTGSIDEEISLSIEAEASDGGRLSYQWQRSINDKNFADIENATSSTLTLNSTSKEGFYVRCVVTNNLDGATSSVISQLSHVSFTWPPAVVVTSENYERLGLAAKHIGYYAISSYNNLLWLSDKVGEEHANYKYAKAVLTCDIDAGCSKQTPWTPIGGFPTYPFNGTFDGNGKTISNLYVKDIHEAGIFRYVGEKDCNEPPVIENLTIKNSTLIGSESAGIVSCSYRCTVNIRNCNVIETTIQATKKSAGGIVGVISSPVNIQNCNVIETTIQATQVSAGGIVGVISSPVNIQNCHVIKTTIQAPKGKAGGIVGVISVESTNTIPIYIENCSCSGSVTALNNVGGIAGEIDLYLDHSEGEPWVFRNCYTSAAVTAMLQNDKIYAGGAFGSVAGRYAGGGVIVTNIYSRGTVASENSECVGAFAGGISQGATVSNCYYDNQVTSLPFATCEDNTRLGLNCSGKTTEEFKSGEVTYMLNERRTNGTETSPLVWYQTLGDDGDVYPTFDATHGIVYADYNENTCILRCTNDATTVTNTPPTHTLTKVEATKANCIAEGNVEYWSCSVCKRLFLDEACTQETIAEGVVIPVNNDHLCPADFTDGLKHCLRCGAIAEMEAAVQVSDENYSALGFTAENYSAFKDYYAITNVGNLYWFANKVNNASNAQDKAVLTADIIDNDGTFDADGNYSPRSGSNRTTPRSWTPIGYYGHIFCGVIDGNGHTISGLYFSKSNGSSIGLVGCSYQATIQNLGVVNCYFSVPEATGGMGGICAENNGGTIQRCYTTGYISGIHAGGICGTLGGGSMESMSSIITATISQCWSSCSILRNHSSNGGICGEILKLSVIRDCYSTGTLAGSDISGVCGKNSGSIINCYTNNPNNLQSGDSNGTIVNSANNVDLATGEICWKLNGSVDDNGKWTAGLVDGSQAWYQKLGEDGDAAPVLTKAADGSNTVYWGYKNCTELGYSNTEDNVDIHDFTAHTPAATADEQTGLYPYTCSRNASHLSTDVMVIKDYAPNAEGEAKNLELTATVNGEERTYSVSGSLNLTDANQFKDVNVEFTTTQAPSYTRTLGTEWGTLVLPFAVSASQVGFEFYNIEKVVGSDALILQKIASGDIAAGTPVFVRRTGEETDLSLTAASNTVNTTLSSAASGMSLQGSYVVVDLSAGYIINNDMLWSVAALTGNSKTVKMAPFHAYLGATAGSMSASLRILADDEATGIANANVEDDMAGAVYNLQGQRLSAPKKGINIVNGKKIMVK